MPASLGRWTATDAFRSDGSWYRAAPARSYSGPTHIEGGFLVRGPDPAQTAARPAPQRQARPAQHTHIHVHGAMHDARPQRRGRDQAGGPARLLARIGQSGQNGGWLGEDGGGRPLIVRTGADGRLEIYHYPDGAEAEAGYDPAERAAPGQDARRRVGDFATLSPNRRTPGDDCAALRVWQDALNAHYGAR